MTRNLLLAVALGLALGGGGRWLHQTNGFAEGASQASGSALTTSASSEATRREIAQALAAPPPALADVLSAKGLDRLVKLAAFLLHASSDDLRALLAEQESMDGTGRDMIFLRWMAVDPAGGLAAARERDLLRNAFWAWANVDFPSALAAAKRERKSANALYYVMLALGQSDPRRARELVNGDPSLRRLGAGMGIAEGFAKRGQWRECMEECARMMNPGSDFMTDWVRQAPEDAFAWALEKARSGAEVSYYRRAFFRIAERQPKKAQALLAAMPEGAKHMELIAEFAKIAASSDLAAAMEAARLGPEPVRQRTLSAIASGLAASHPDEAFEILRQVDWKQSAFLNAFRAEYPQGATGNGGDDPHLAGAVSELIRVEPAKTAAFLETLPDTDQTRTAYRIAMSTWLEDDAKAASTWLSTLPTGPRKDEAIEFLVGHLRHMAEPDYEAAVHWQMAHSQATQNESRLREIFHDWHSKNPQAAANGLAIPGISESLRQELQQRFQQSP